MDKNVFDYLRIIGFKDDEINYIEENNDNIVYVDLIHVKKIILFLHDLGLNIQEIRKVCTNNIYVITESFRRINRLNTIYFEELKLNRNQIKELIIKNSNIYTVNPNKIEKIIKFLKNNNYSNEEIRNFIINKTKIIGMEFEDFEKMIKFN